MALPAQASDRLYTEAVQAIGEGIPQVGIQKLHTYLAGNLSAEERIAAQLRLAEALIAAGDPAGARDLLKTVPASPEAQFIMVQTRLAAGEWAAALQALDDPLLAGPSLFQKKAIFARAEAQRGLGQGQEAAENYAKLENDLTLGPPATLCRAELALEANDVPLAARLLGQPDLASQPQTRYLQARLALARKNFPAALALFKQLQAAPEQLTARVYAGVEIGLARAEVGIRRPEDAEDSLEKFLGENPDSPALQSLFIELDQVYASEKNPTSAEMRVWTHDADHPQRQALAITYISRFDGRDKGDDAALKTLEGWITRYPKHPLLAGVLLEEVQVLTRENRWSDAAPRIEQALALHPPPPLTGKLLMAAGEASFGLEKYAEAAAKFSQAADLMSGMAETLLYNSALCWLRAGDFARFLEVYQLFSRRFAESGLRRDLIVEEGQLQARSGDVKDARQTLGLLIRDFPEHPRIPEARLTLAELAFTASPPDLATTKVEMDKVEQSMPSPGVAAQAAYLHIFQTERSAPGKEADLIALANDFLTKYADSPLIPEVRMKLGEIYFRQKDYANARTQFEIIEKSFSDSPLYEKALFLGGQSAIRSMNPDAVDGAIATLEKVVALKGPLAPYARFEEAKVKSDTGKLDEALVLYDDLLGKKPDADLLFAALAGKGETLYLRGAVDPKAYEQAATVFDQMAALPDVPPHWRDLVLYKKGKALEKLGKTDAAVTAYYDVINPDPAAAAEPEWLWYYRAGFDAGQLLENQSQWSAALAIYRKLADSAGPRAGEAKERADRLALEHFIWDK